MEVYLIRHTSPDIEKGICYGLSDIPLAASFYQEAENLWKHIPSDIDIIYSSPLSRCQKLAKNYELKDLNLRTDTRLSELNFGDWEMKKWNDIDPEQLNNWMQDFVNVRTPNGENFTEMNIRVNNFIDEMLKEPGEKVAVITHAGVIRCFVARVLEIPLKNAFKIPVDYASVTKIHVGEDGCFSNIAYLNKI